MSKVLVTGGLGFIGSNIVDLLIEKGHEVVVVDDLSTGSKKNINLKAKFYRKDLCSSDFRSIYRKEAPEYVVHEAAQISRRKSAIDPLHDASINIMGSINLLECCRKYETKKVIYASSGGAVYGEPLNLPVDESHPLKPRTPYGASKRCVEDYLNIYRKNHGLDCVSLRYSNVYGPRQDPCGEAGVVSIFIKRMLEETAPIIYGDGNQTRDFVHVRDVALANLAALEKETKAKEINIATGKETSINTLYEKLGELTGSKEQAFHGKAVPGEFRRISLDIGLAEKELGWKPETSLEDGLKQTVEWYKNCR
ncbi:MAG: NAD-dependent epimerase/dehydratase family protein [Candidatus Altiarchaeota archaeon]|nr:NAD-dependent epimerase/dehydratase family protein [Candidatus Altiarchaeota archaeon]